MKEFLDRHGQDLIHGPGILSEEPAQRAREKRLCFSQSPQGPQRPTRMEKSAILRSCLIPCFPIPKSFLPNTA
jgi:hypothetical protein